MAEQQGKYWHLQVCTLEEVEDVLNSLNDKYVVLDLISLRTTGNGHHLMGVVYIDPACAPTDQLQLSQLLGGDSGTEVLQEWEPSKKDRPQ